MPHTTTPLDEKGQYYRRQSIVSTDKGTMLIVDVLSSIRDAMKREYAACARKITCATSKVLINDVVQT